MCQDRAMKYSLTCRAPLVDCVPYRRSECVVTCMIGPSRARKRHQPARHTAEVCSQRLSSHTSVIYARNNPNQSLRPGHKARFERTRSRRSADSKESGFGSGVVRHAIEHGFGPHCIPLERALSASAHMHVRSPLATTQTRAYGIFACSPLLTSWKQV